MGPRRAIIRQSRRAMNGDPFFSLPLPSWSNLSRRGGPSSASINAYTMLYSIPNITRTKGREGRTDKKADTRRIETDGETARANVN